MLTKLTIRNFKRFGEVSIELGNPVVFVGPNDSGKTSALQALTLWDTGLRRWSEKRGGEPSPAKRSGVAINRRDLTGVPVPAARLLWKDLDLRTTSRDQAGKQRTQNIHIDVVVEGSSPTGEWVCGLEYDFANDESIYCRPARDSAGGRMPIPAEALSHRVVLLGPMSGLASDEPKLEPGAINVRIGQGRTAEVLRNLCHLLLDEGGGGGAKWTSLAEQMQRLFGVVLTQPRLIAERGEVVMNYRDGRHNTLDLSSAGRGMQQTLLLLAFLALNPGAVVLLDEPDAHLEVLRQKQTYELLSQAASVGGGQVIIASHSEVILNEAADRDVVVAFVGAPHRIDDRGSQVLKALKEIGYEDYYQAEITGLVLYLEGPTDLAILRSLAKKLAHPAEQTLSHAFVKYVGNQPNRAQSHFFGLREAKPDLVGAALFDRLTNQIVDQGALRQKMWRRREIENYICQPATLLEYAVNLGRTTPPEGLFEASAAETWSSNMRNVVDDRVPPIALRNAKDVFWIETKASDDFLVPLFADFFERLGMLNLMQKTDFHSLVAFVAPSDVDPEVVEVLDWIASVDPGTP